MLASDAVHFYEELELERPFAVMHDLEQMYAAYDVLKGLAQAGADGRSGPRPGRRSALPAGRHGWSRLGGADRMKGEQGHGTRARKREEVHEVAHVHLEGGGVSRWWHWCW